MTQACETPRVGQLVRQVARPERRADGYLVVVDHVFVVLTGDDAAPLYPLRVTVETAVAEESGGLVLAALEERARSELDTLLALRMPSSEIGE